MGEMTDLVLEQEEWVAFSVTRGDARLAETAQRATRRAKRRRDAFVAVSVDDPWLMSERASLSGRLYVQADRLARELARRVLPNLDANPADADWLRVTP